MNPPHRIIFWLCLLLFSQLGCGKLLSSSVTQQSSGSPTPIQATLPHTQNEEQPEYPELELFDSRTGEEKESAPINYNGFQVRSKTKKVLVEGTTRLTELSFAQLLRKRKVVMTFDKVEDSIGNETRFGLFPFLSPDSRQLLVRQEAWRSSREWIVALDKQPRVLMNSGEYRLEGFRAMDLDRDGQFELVGVQRYWYFEFLKGLTFSSADSPDITIVFAYNWKTQKYEPANPRFKAFLLERVEEIKSRFAGTDAKTREGYPLIRRMRDVMDGTFTLALIGEESAAWEFFDQYCPAEKPEEKADAKSRIRFALRENTIYKMLKRLIKYSR